MKAHRWPIGLAIILFLTVLANIAVMYVAGRDDSFAVEPDYYAKAIAWDSTLAQARHNQALGWRLVPALDEFASRNGARLLVSLTDSTGRPVADATITVSAFYNARASHVLTATLAAGRDGYSARLAVNHGGQWELRFDVRRGAEHFTATTRIDVAPASIASIDPGA